MTHKRIFISYARPDMRVVGAIEQFLRVGTGLDTWLDKRDLLAGEDWRLVIEREIAKATLLVLCLSTNSVDRTGFFQKELRLAFQQAELRPRAAVFIVPIRLNPCTIPSDIAQWQLLDMFEPEATYRLLTAIGNALPNVGVRADKEEHAKLTKAVEDYNRGPAR